ncbi:MAG: right-handed parallel beta-helix repeat-containing protein [Phycisphaerales bacterium]|nr:MAG: right-handed parallel beta-helix repeat-containing protein [Phycisphaerales bacterium]
MFIGYVSDYALLLGAPIFEGPSRARFEDCTFTNNVADPNTTQDNEDAFISYGGAVAFIDGAEPTFENCSFSNNLATVGGGVYGQRSNSLLADSSFAGNAAYRGGGAHIVGGSTEIARSNFTSNLASSVIDVYIDPNDPNAPFIDPNLLAVPIGSGGAICFIDADATIYDSTMVGNNTQVSGGGMLISGSENVLVRNCLITNNSSGRDGGGVSVNWSAKPQIINCTIADNSVTGYGFAAGYGGGLYGSYTSATTVVDSILWGNTADLGMQIAVGTGFEFDSRPADVNVLYSDVQGGAMAAFVDTDCTFNFGPNSIMADPLFVAGPLDNYYLSQFDAGQSVDSPAVDAGSADANEVGLDTYTTRTSAIPDSNTVDMGYHRSVFFGNVQYGFVLRVIGPGTVAVEPNIVDPNNPLYDPANNVYTYQNYGGSTFRLTATPEPGYRVKRWSGADNDPAWKRTTNTVTLYRDRTVVVEFEKDVVQNLLVPSGYRTIEEAVAAASPGDTNIIVAEGTHYVTNPNGIDLQGKRINVMSEDPNDPNVVAHTIIDCQGSRFANRRAFHFRSGEGPDTVIAGFTIRNGFIVGVTGITGGIPGGPVNPGDTNSPFRAASGTSAIGNGYGGAILCEGRSSPTIRNCVITDNTVIAAWGGDGVSGPPLPDGSQLDGIWGGDAGSGMGDGYGGAIACLGESSPIITGCTIKNNMARGGTGGTGGSGSNPNDGSGRESWGGDGGFAYGDGIGGGIYCANGCAPVITDCIFSNNLAKTGSHGSGGSAGPGSALNDPYPNPAGPGMPGIVFPFGNVAGGAAYYEASDANFTNCLFEDNVAAEGHISYYSYGLYGIAAREEEVLVYTLGGALYSGPGNTVTLRNCEFHDNLGGAVYIESTSAVDMNECLFSDNQMLGEEEIDFYTPLLWSIFDPNFAPATLERSGGAVYIGPGCTGVNFDDCEFYTNYALDDGGAVRLRSDANFTDCAFGGNKTSGNGGAIEAYYDSGDPNIVVTLNVDLEACVFGGNQATESLSGWGGGVHFQDFDATFTDCYFIANRSKSGGGLFLSNGTVALTGGGIKSNEAVGGSGVDTSGELADLQLYLMYPIFDEYIGYYFSDPSVLGEVDVSAGEAIGGGLVCANTEAMIENCILTENVANGVDGRGGAISFYGGYVEHVVKNCLLTGNSATESGGAVGSALFATPTFENCTFSDNAANRLGSAIYCDWSSDPTISDCIFASCNNHAIGEQDFGNAVIQYSLFHDNAGGDYGIYDSVTGETDTLAAADIDVTNKEADPLFVAGPFGDYYLSQTDANDPADSPAVDSGSDFASAAGMSELTTRTDGGRDHDIVDLGYHYQDHSVVPKYHLTASVIGGHGGISPTSGTYYEGTLVSLTAYPESGWRIAKWSGTIDDTSRRLDNAVIMGSDRHITIEFEQPRTILLGSDPNYTSMQHVIDEAADGDVIMLETGEYRPAASHQWRPWGFEMIEIRDKQITLTSLNPDDPDIVASTVLDNYWIRIINVGSDVVIDGLTIRNSQRDGGVTANATPVNDDGPNGNHLYGGAMQVFNGSPVIRNCVFVDCSVTGGDGAPGDNGTQQHPVGFDGGWGGKAYGGAVYCGYNASPRFENCSFTNCFARGGNGGNGGDGDGGAKGGRGGNWEWGESLEEKFASTWWDGWEWGDNLYLGLFILGTTVYDAYDAYVDPYWKYSGYGGAVYCETFSSPEFVDCTFTNNHSYGGVAGVGGFAWPSPDRNLKIETAGGAVYACEGSDPEFVRCVFVNNSADPSNDYIATDDSLQTVILNDDPYVSYGGAVAFEDDCSPKFVDCTFTNSQACVGGAMWWSRSDPIIAGCNFENNTAYHGGGLYSVEATGTISGSTVTGNRAYADVVLDPNDPNVVLDLGVVLGRGGGYYCLSSIVEVNDSIFSGNQANLSGGGIYVAASDQHDVLSPVLHNSLITGNTAGRDGGGISVVWYAEPTISNCTIVDNAITGALGYGGGLYCAYDSNTVVVDSIIWGNVAIDGSQIGVGMGLAEYGKRPSTLHITYSDIQPDPDPNEIQPPTKLDVVLLIDTTGSMWDDIDAVKAGTIEIVNRIAAEFPDYRIAVVDYRDVNEAPYGVPGVDYPFNDDLDFSSDLAAIQTGIDSLTLGAGADWRESVYSGLMHAIDGNSLGGWRDEADVSRAILLIGDAPPHDPEPTTNYTLGDVITAATTGTPKKIFSIPVDGDPITSRFFSFIAEGSGGELLQAASAAELIDAIMAAIGLIWRQPVSIYVEPGCVVEWWSADSNSWDPASHNIGLDPNFTAGYYLSQRASGQLIDSVCVDAGSGDANDPRIALDDHSTRTDGVGDANTVDMGYHYREGLTQYELTVEVVGDPNDPNVIRGHVDPNFAIRYKGFGDNLVTLTAHPDPGYKVKLWQGTDDDTSTNWTNVVTLDEDKHVLVEFEPAPLHLVCADVVDRGDGPHGIIIVDADLVDLPGLPDPNFPCQGMAYDGMTIPLKAVADPNYEVRRWFGTDNDLSREPNNTVTVRGDSVYVAVEFGPAGQNVINLYNAFGTLDRRSPFLTIQAAIDASDDNYEVRLSDGIYTGVGNYDLNLSAGLDPNEDRPITIASENGPDNCIIDCEGLGRGFIFDSNEDPNYVLNGLTVRGGFAEYGGAIMCENSSPTIRDCKILDSYATGNGGGIYLTNSSPIIVNTEISNNRAGGFGGGIYGENASAAEIINCLITRNYSSDIGGAIYLWASDATINLTTIAYNYGLSYADLDGPKGGIACRDASPTITNSIIGRSSGDYGEWGDSFQGDDLYNCTTSNSCIENGDDAGSNGNIDDDPLWVTGSLGEFYLSQDVIGLQSPCVDAGEQYILQQLQTTYNLGDVTTSILHQADTGFADMGYHYPYGYYTGPELRYTLQLSVVGNGQLTATYYEYSSLVIQDGVYDFNDTVVEVNEATSPVTLDLTPGTYVTLLATADRGFRLYQWTGTDNDSSVTPSNVVSMDSHKIVTIEFEPWIARTIEVPSGEYPTIQSAVFAAREGDTVVVDEGRYFGGYQSMGLIVDKSITITSRYPHDPCCVEATVIDGYRGTNPEGWFNVGVVFTSNTDANTVLNGFTIENCGGQASDGDDGDRGQGHPNGEDGASAEAMGILIGAFGGPVIKNCVVRNNVAVGGDGGNGENADADNNAGRGGWGGWAHGGGVYCGVYSTPTFINCRIEDNLAYGGNGGDGGNYASPGGMANYGGNYSSAQAYHYDPDGLGMEYVPGNLWEVWDWDYAGMLSMYLTFDTGAYLTLYTDPNYAFLFDVNDTSYAGDYRWYSAYGGGVFCDKGSTVSFEHCEIRGNRTYGGISGQGGELGPSGRPQEPLVPYELPSYGAGVYCAEDTTVTFTGSTFEDNVASEVDPTDPNHRLNPYSGYGGGVCAEKGATVSFTDCNFVDNLADSGGGIYVEDVNAVITDCNIVANRALRGGGFLGIGGSVEVRASNVMYNWATIDPNDPNNNEDILSVGAGLCYFSGDASIRDCNISGNRADGSGGGVYMRGAGGASLINCLITDNAAGRDGGGASINWLGDPLIRNCTFVGNAASGTMGDPNKTGLGGALFCGYGSDCTVTDSIFGDNYGIQGSAVAVGSGFELDPICATLRVSYSDIKDAPNDIWFDTGCTLDLDTDSVIDDDPLFVAGLLGDFYLSQRTAGQSRTSPCVNAGSDFAANLGMTRYTTRTDSVPDRNIVDMGYHYPLTEPCRFSDLALVAEGILRDGVIDFADLRVLALRWLDQGCSEDDGWCGGADISFDTSVDLKDLAFLADCWRVEDIEAPTPNPSEWEEEPNMVASGTITMTAETAYDAWGWPVEYYFDCVFGNGHDSKWQSSPRYTDSGLSDGRYGYRVRAREARGNCDDPSVSCNATEWSVVRYAGRDDLTPPQPAPYIESIDPSSSSVVDMLATIAYDESGVEYYFEADPNYPGGNDSGWQIEPNYTDTDLDPDTVYRYRVKARDMSDNQNETAWSDWFSVRTPVAPDMLAPTPNPMEWADPNGAPREFQRGTAFNDYWAQMLAETATDASGGVEYYFECIDSPLYSSGWQVDPYYEVWVGRPYQKFTFRVRAQDQYGNKTEWSVPARAE